MLQSNQAAASSEGGAAEQDRSFRLASTSRLTDALRKLVGFLPLLGFFLAWEIYCRAYPATQVLLPAPSEVVHGAWQLLSNGSLQRDIIASLRRVLLAMGAASIIGFPLGIALGISPTFRWLVEPLVSFFRPIPPLAWIPLSIIWFGIDDLQNVFIIFLGAFFPIVLNTMQGVRDVEPQLIRAARTLGAKQFTIIRTVVLPAALPTMFVGLRVGLGIAWMALVAGELVAATSGLGFLISQGRNLFRTDYIVVGMVAIGLIGLLLDGAITMVGRAVMRWKGD